MLCGRCIAAAVQLVVSIPVANHFACHENVNVVLNHHVLAPSALMYCVINGHIQLVELQLYPLVNQHVRLGKSAQCEWGSTALPPSHTDRANCIAYIAYSDLYGKVIYNSHVILE